EPLPPTWTVLRSRGPFDVVGEEALLRDHGVGVVMTKDSGGSFTSAKLEAARALGVPVVVVALPSRTEGAARVSDAAAAADWVDALAGQTCAPRTRGRR